MQETKHNSFYQQIAEHSELSSQNLANTSHANDIQVCTGHARFQWTCFSLASQHNNKRAFVNIYTVLSAKQVKSNTINFTTMSRCCGITLTPN